MHKVFDLVVDTTQKITNKSIQVNTNDLQTVKFNLNITQDGKSVDLTGATVRIAIVKPDKTTVFQDCTITNAVEGQCEVVLNTQAYVIEGMHIVEVMVYYTAEMVSVTSRFPYTVRKGVLNDSAVESTNDWQAINQAIADAEGILIDLRENGTAVDAFAREELNSVNSQLAQITPEVKIARVNSQVDFVSDLQKLASQHKIMNVEVVYGTSQVFHVNIKISDTKGVAYKFQKNANDDYILQYGSFIGDVENIYAVTDSRNYTKKTGTFVETYPPNFYTLTVGDSIEFEFEGTRIDFYSYCTPQGGLWEFILDEGTGGEQRKEVSCFNAVDNIYKQPTLFNNLDLKKHTVKGVFKGEDPTNPVSNPRGYFYVGGLREQDKYRTFYVYNDTFKLINTQDILYSASNKEYALEARPAGSTKTMQYIPEHNSTGTAFKIAEAKLLADGNPVEWVADSYSVNVKTVQLIQKVHGVFPSDPSNPLVEITTYHTIKDGVLTISGKIKFLRDTEIGNGYTMMFPYWVSFAKQILTSMGNQYDVISATVKETEYIPEKDENKSFLILNDVDSADDRIKTALAMTVDNFKQTMRLGEVGTSPSETRIEHRSTTIGKIYLHQLKNVTIPAGYEYKFDGRFITTIIDEVKDLYL